ncbi:NADP-reducing hydrogenase subunit HndD [Dethiosulfatibacter aminovorans DSM 17477]|uniref:NADP-reducing hydrogenase subunit HndD n=1 Tax=Dethiosulfatibacter aminovorans DSM 17477 TaxID=1121476 RepID=A0A1M6JWR3_9FIRM|nr:NADH-dependent [FeFe] hydrogenase, group A6 [Dethiosulfatibacter aminovorans]SHJ51101.1 NADP-reducing hydrogenase subunit HndD [Dethiosulfatibacter aminovorans DSM 17477]
MANITINNKVIEASPDKTILQVAKENNILIPHLCYLEGVHEIGACRLCVVEVEGVKNLMASCITKVQDGMNIKTNTQRVRNARKVMYELILSNHPKNCLSCERNNNCELQALGGIIGVEEDRFAGEMSKDIVDISSAAIERDMSKCILCRRCETMCNDIQKIGILNTQERGFKSVINPGQGLMLDEASCTFCGQCTKVCPVGALKEKSSIENVWDALNDGEKVVIVETAPAIRAALGEEFGLPPGTSVTGKMASALRELGFDYVFDTNFAADLTIMEEGYEFLGRIKDVFINGKDATFPMITSCSPGWIKYIEHYYPDQLDNLSSCKSPHMMLGALTKSFFADRTGIDPESIYVVSIMPCTAKKYEITRPEMVNNGLNNVDAVLTTREFARMIKDAGVDFLNLEDGTFDSPMGVSSGAADIFGNTGGVMEAAVRTVYELITGRELPFENLHIKPIMGVEKIKTASLLIENPVEEWKALDGVEVNIAVTSGLDGAGQLLEEIKQGKSKYHFIEIMACPGGCINGGGQPRSDDPEIREKRISCLYTEDEMKTLRKSHENKDILKLYEDFLEKPLGHHSHELLHTTYTKRKRSRD